jgi:hypothetical protein
LRHDLRIKGTGPRSAGALRAPATPEGPGTGGAPTFEVYVRQGEQGTRANDGACLRPGDALRFVVRPGRSRHLLVVGIDGAGQATVYHPYGAAASGPLPQGAGSDAPALALPGSIELDAAAGPERIYALFSEVPLAAAGVREALLALHARGPGAVRAAATLPLALPAVTVRSFLLEKAVGPGGCLPGAAGDGR